MNTLRQFASYLKKHNTVPHHLTGELEEYFREEGKSAADRALETVDWGNAFRDSELELTTRVELFNWIENYFTGILFGNLQEFTDGHFRDSDIFCSLCTDDSPELKSGILTLFEDNLFPAFISGAYSRLGETEPEIIKKII